MTDFEMTVKMRFTGSDMDQAIDRLEAWFKMSLNSNSLSDYIVGKPRLLRCDKIEEKKKP